VRTAGFGWKFAACAGAALTLVAGACSSRDEARVSTDARTTTSVAESPDAAGAERRPGTTVHQHHAPSTRVTVTTSGTTVAPLGGAGTITTVPVTISVVPPPTNPPATHPPTHSPTHPPTTAPPPKPYDPAKPIDLSGTPGVSPAQQARAEQLIRDTLRDTKKYANPSAAFADGYRSIGDASTGDEHYVKWAYSDDGHILDSKRPESLVYERKNGKPFLAAAMYSLPPGSSFADVPDVGGPLTQWHVHNDLCLRDDPGDPLAKVVSSITGINGKCPPGSSKLGAAPMLHVWVVPNRCGPFAALEGIGAGQIPPGETRLCDSAHGG
jgi:hypothetical protein